jgi:hypothetical protein
MLNKNDLTALTIRDMTMGLLEVCSGGLRGVAIRSLTYGEYNDRETVSKEPLRVVIRCHAHKTMKFYGAALVVVTNPMILDLLNTYVEHVRPQIGPTALLSTDESPLFPTKTAK